MQVIPTKTSKQHPEKTEVYRIDNFFFFFKKGPAADATDAPQP
jgi:hypothetical protein